VAKLEWMDVLMNVYCSTNMWLGLVAGM